jgi:uncharacterized RDD family membrane protein YckC
MNFMSETQQNYCRPSVFRHLAVMLYDTVLLLSVLLLASLIAVAFNSGEAIDNNNPFFMFYLISVSGFFYGWFWTHGGQTLGMRAWKVQIRDQQQNNISWKQVVIRFVVAIISWLLLGLGFWWQYLGKDTQNWPDYFSGTHLIYNKNAKHKSLSPLS